jgi:hypothetical protein
MYTLSRTKTVQRSVKFAGFFQSAAFCQPFPEVGNPFASGLGFFPGFHGVNSCRGVRGD